MTPNPYEVLHLTASATEEDVVRRAARIRRRGADETTMSAVRQAVQALTGHPRDRLRHSVLTPPAAAYDWPEIERFAGNHRRRPPSAAAHESASPAEFDLAEFAALVRPLLIAELAYVPLPLEPPAVDETPSELLRQTVEALWQGLPFDTLG